MDEEPLRSATGQLWFAGRNRLEHGAHRWARCRNGDEDRGRWGLLIIGIADNLTDSLSVHIYQEAERLAERQAFQTTVSNYVARLAVSVSFACLFFLLPSPVAIYACLLWRFFLLCGLTYLLANARGVGALAEICKHADVAVVVIVTSKAVGLLVRAMMGSA